MQKVFRFVRVVAFAVLLGLWLTAFIAGMTGCVVMAVSQNNFFTPEVQGIIMLVTVVIQAVWGLVMGSLAHARGWQGAIGSRFTNWLSLTLFHGLIAMPASVVLSGLEFHRTGRFVPTPSESRC